MNIKQRGWLIFLFAITLGLLSYLYPGILTRPGQCIPSMGGDGIKNEFTYLYHILYGYGPWFMGMNYPYGEHIIYGDGQPILSIPLAALHHIIPFSPDVAFIILLWCLIISYLLAAYFLFKILTHQGVKQWIASLFAFLILFLSPQVFRMSGHFGLAYPSIIPMELYWLLRYHYSAKKKYPAYIAIITTIAALLHLYFLATSLLIMGSYILYTLFFSGTTFKSRSRKILPLFLAVLAAFITVQSFVILTDPLHDRPETPYGILGACSSLRDLFTNSRSAIWQGLEEAGIGPHLQDSGEGLMYPGFMPLLALLTGIIALIWAMLKPGKTFKLPRWLLPKAFAFIAVVSVAIAFGIPFIWGLETLPERLPLVRQFRALGRFGWSFYYLAALSGSLIIYHYYSTLHLSGKKASSVILIVVVLAAWALEVNGYVIPMHNEGVKWQSNHDDLWSKNEESWTQHLQSSGYHASDFQAILLLPYFHIGTEKVWTGQEYDKYSWQMVLGAKASLQLQLPIMDAMMSRSSWGRAESLNRLAAGPYAYKEVLNLLKDNRPILVLSLISTPPNPDQAYLFQYADSIGHTGFFNVHALYPDRLRSADSARMLALKNLAYNPAQNDTCLNCTDPWFIQHSSTLQQRRLFFGKITWPGNITKDTPIANFALSLSRDSILYECSVWTLTPSNNYRTPDFRILGADSLGHQLLEKDMPTKWAYDANGNWFRASAWLNLPIQCKSIRVLIHKEESLPTSFDLEELQLRPASAVIFSRDYSGRPMINNHFYKLY